MQLHEGDKSIIPFKNPRSQEQHLPIQRLTFVQDGQYEYDYVKIYNHNPAPKPSIIRKTDESDVKQAPTSPTTHQIATSSISGGCST